MKAEVNIKNGEAKIILTCENRFEEEMINNAKDDKKYVSITRLLSDYTFGTYENQRIEITLTNKDTTPTK